MIWFGVTEIFCAQKSYKTWFNSFLFWTMSSLSTQFFVPKMFQYPQIIYCWRALKTFLSLLPLPKHISKNWFCYLFSSSGMHQSHNFVGTMLKALILCLYLFRCFALFRFIVPGHGSNNSRHFFSIICFYEFRCTHDPTNELLQIC